jgi:ABC-type proline/glycine betaine transport system permease subunit
MILSYTLRLLSLCFAAFFLVHAAAGLTLCLVERSVIRMAERFNPRSAARFLLLVRMLPFATSLAVVVGVCAPSYVRFEQNVQAEQIRFACPAMALFGFLVLVIALRHGLYTAIRSFWFNRLCRRFGRTVQPPGQPWQILVIQQGSPFLAQCGIFRSQFVISQVLLDEFPPEELTAALRHEYAHSVSCDNLKRLLFAFLPDFVPLWPSFKTLERNWAKFAERAADDHVASASAAGAVSLASALVRLARMGTCAAQPPAAPVAVSPLVGYDDLTGRVHRLLSPQKAAAAPARISAWLCGASLFAIGCLAVLVSPAAMLSVHQLLERLLH